MEMCQYNAAMASSANRPDVVKAWSVAAVVASTDGPVSDGLDTEECPWPMHPFARPLIHSLSVITKYLWSMCHCICIPTGCHTMVRFMIYRQWQCCPVCFTRTINILPPS